jgi:hypothetical protein
MHNKISMFYFITLSKIIINQIISFKQNLLLVFLLI